LPPLESTPLSELTEAGEDAGLPPLHHWSAQHGYTSTRHQLTPHHHPFTTSTSSESPCSTPFHLVSHRHVHRAPLHRLHTGNGQEGALTLAPCLPHAHAHLRTQPRTALCTKHLRMPRGSVTWSVPAMARARHGEASFEVPLTHRGRRRSSDRIAGWRDARRGAARGRKSPVGRCSCLPRQRNLALGTTMFGAFLAFLAPLLDRDKSMSILVYLRGRRALERRWGAAVAQEWPLHHWLVHHRVRELKGGVVVEL
jgi:hypothetical protein